MKRILTLVALLLVASTSFAQLVPRTVLLEEGTNWSCGPCAVYNPNVDTFLAAHEGSVIHLAYHPNWPGANDPMYLNDQTDNQYRVATYYGISGVPSVVFDGGTSFVPGYVEQLEAGFQERFAVGSPIALTVTHSVEGDYMKVHVVVHPVADVSSYKRLYLRVASVEDWVDGPGPNGEEKYVHAMREMMPDYQGTALTLTNEEQSFDFQYEIKPDYAPERLYEVAFIQSDASKEVVQAATDKPGFSLQPSPGEKWVERVSVANSTQLNLGLSNTTGGDLNFDITYTPTSTNQWPVLINGNEPTTVQHVAVKPGESVPLTIQASKGNGAYMSGYVTVRSTVGDENLQSVFPVKFIAPDVKLALVDVSADSIRSAPVAATMDANYYYVPLTSGEMSVMNAWRPAEFPEIVVEGNKWIVTGATKTALGAYVQAGGHALVHGGEIAFGLADAQSSSADRDAAFLRNVLHVTYVKDSAGPHTVRGVAGDSVSGDFASSSIDIYAQNIDAPNQPDEIKPYNNTSTPIFYYGDGNQIAGVRWDSGPTRVVYLSFGLQNLATSDQTRILKNSIDWLRAGPAASVGGTEPSLSFSLYPNPASREVHVSFAADQDIQSVSIVDVTGRTVASEFVNGRSDMTLDLSALPKGAYLCVVRSSTGSVTRPIAVE